MGFGLAFKKQKRRINARGLPWQFAALRQIIHAQPNLLKQVVQRQAALLDHLNQSRCVGAVGVFFIRPDGAGRGVKGNQCSGVRLDERQTTGNLGGAFGERVFARGVQDYNAGFERHGGQRLGQV